MQTWLGEKVEFINWSLDAHSTEGKDSVFQLPPRTHHVNNLSTMVHCVRKKGLPRYGLPPMEMELHILMGLSFTSKPGVWSLMFVFEWPFSLPLALPSKLCREPEGAIIKLKQLLKLILNPWIPSRTPNNEGSWYLKMAPSVNMLCEVYTVPTITSLYWPVLVSMSVWLSK